MYSSQLILVEKQDPQCNTSGHHAVVTHLLAVQKEQETKAFTAKQASGAMYIQKWNERERRERGGERGGEKEKGEGESHVNVVSMAALDWWCGSGQVVGGAARIDEKQAQL